MAYDPYPGGGYQQYPGGTDSLTPQEPLPAPPAVRNAVKLMYAGAVVSLISVIVNLSTTGSLKTAIHKASPSLTPSQVSSVATASLILGIVLGALGVGLWIWLGMMSQAGRNWARVTGTALFGIDTILQVVSFTRSADALARIPGLIVWVIGLAAVILLWQRASTAYFTR